MFSNTLRTLRNTDRPRWFDWTFFGVFVAVCFVFFCHWDLQITALQSYDLLSLIKNGKFLSFYQFVADKAVAGEYFTSPAGMLNAANYNIILYLALAIWLLPVKTVSFLFHLTPSINFLTFYSKILILGLLLASGYLLYRLGQKFQLDERSSKWLAFLYMSSPALLFGSVLYGQLEIICIFLTLLGLKFYMDKKYMMFSLVISVALCFKEFAILAFVPLILLAEKRILHILKYGVVGGSLFLLTKVLAAFDPGYSITQEFMSDRYGFVDRLFNPRLPTTYMGAPVFIFLFILLCCLCYFVQPKDEDRKYWVTFIPLASFGFFFCFISYSHPQWNTLIYPFVALLLMLIQNKKAALLFDCGMQAGFLMLIVFYFKHFQTVRNGLLGILFDKPFVFVSFDKYLGDNEPRLQALSLCLMVACFIALIILAYVGLIRGKNRVSADNPQMLERGLVWIRLALLFIVFVPGIFGYIKQIYF